MNERDDLAELSRSNRLRFVGQRLLYTSSRAETVQFTLDAPVTSGEDWTNTVERTVGGLPVITWEGDWSMSKDLSRKRWRSKGSVKSKVGAERRN